MRPGGQGAITIALIFAFLCWPTAAFADFTGKVVRVMDGDTLEVLTQDMTPIRVRLSGIDCPEKGQAFGQRAKQAASDLAFGKTVEVRDTGRDRYGRTVGEVMLQDGRSLNRELVRAGLAWWYRQYAKKDADLARLEEEAREAKLGLWADADPVPPWNWRKERRLK
jgi:endonuclease YncB( thermonuclease family)